MHAPILAPSILAGNHANLASSAQIVADLGLKWLHIDIMDGHFVPNLTFGPQTVAALRKTSDLFFDVHLMLDEPAAYLEPFAKAGANSISIHIEPNYDHRANLSKIRELGCRRGIVINPGTPVSSIEHLLDQVELVLVMTVQPGFGGQPFRDDMLGKLEKLSALRTQRGLDFRLEVDGGIDLETGLKCRKAGADTFVAGTAFFASGDRKHFADVIAAW
ncbi:MAG TPA: ribulose-phosphate 3-epimerase [Opitutaceae bacterium]|nr:ribulose-phosphate 3-epimerase [Opitutaceae bacterium]